MKNQNYFIGLDIGTNSVGYAVTDEDHNLLKFKGEAMWGSHIFDEANQCADRRGFRTARRRLARRKQRVRLVQEIFAREIAKVDEHFFVRLKESALFAEDKTNKDPFSYFVDNDFTDKDFHKKYPTIHHLIMSLIEDESYHDPRLVYLAVAWIVAHRGHFLCEVSKDDIKSILDFNTVYNDLIDYAENNDLEIYLTRDMAEGLKEILLLKVGVTLKKAKIKENLFDGKEEKPTEETFILQKELITLLAGGQTDTSKLFPSIDDENKQSVSLAKNEEEFVALLATLDDANAEILRRLRAIYEWSLLSEAVSGEKYISQAKKKVYDVHKIDLNNLKHLVQKYLGKEGLKKVFKSDTKDNYVCYSYNLKNLSNTEKNNIKKTTKEDFCAFVKKEVLSKIIPNPEDKALYDDIKAKVEANTFMPKQVNGDNRVIPYQLYYVELKEILQNASVYLPFLIEKDEDGYTAIEKLLSIMEFRIPYYVGPLHKDEKSRFAWITKKATGQIRPWNFTSKVDLEQCEQDFINRMTCTCTYMTGEDVLPKHSLLYEKYTVLNEINNLKINSVPITVEAKQKIFEELFCKRRKVTPKALNEFMTTNGIKQKDDVLTGVDIEYKINSSLSSYHDFKRFLEAKLLTEEQVEEIIERITYVSDNRRLKKWLTETFSFLSQEDINYISKLHYADFGRLSKKFLAEKFAQAENGQKTSIIGALWNTNYNLMELIHLETFTFGKKLEQHRKEYYASHPATVNSIMEELYISNAVKRPIFRTLDIVKDIEKAMGHAPSKIFVEMARGGQTEKKRTTSRLDQIKAYYKTFPKSEVKQLDHLINELNGVTNNDLQSRKLFLYFMQLGKCMYSGEAINLAELKSKDYDIEHIFPQCYVKDDSFDNIVLVNSRLNGQKSDTYPIQQEIRSKMFGFWKNLLDKNLISKKKYERLTRSTPFSDAERQGFIDRQLVETRQSTKAVAEILHARYEKQIADSKLSEKEKPEIVYVKAGLVSDFRHEYNLPKARTINDLHHAKDAYLNIVCGDVYNSRFNKNFKKNLHRDTKYSIKTGTVFGNEVKLGNRLVWRGADDVAKTVNTLSKNNIHLTRFAFERKGGLFDQMPLSASAGLLPRKKGLDTEKYGGYAKTTCSFFMLVAYTKNDKRDMMFVPIELMVAERVKKDKNFALCYVKQRLNCAFKKKEISDISLPLGLRSIKINTVLSLNGCRIVLTGQDDLTTLSYRSLMPLVLDRNWRQLELLITERVKKKDVSFELDIDWERYTKSIENFNYKKNQNKDSIVIDGEYDGITKDKNIEFYELLFKKSNTFPFNEMSNLAGWTLAKKLSLHKEAFYTADEYKQVDAIANILLFFMTNRAGRCNFTSFGGTDKESHLTLSANLSGTFQKFSQVKIIDTSASGLFENEIDLRNYL